MNKKLLCLLISSFLLSGCANFKKINANELAAEKDAQKTRNIPGDNHSNFCIARRQRRGIFSSCQF
ncbi:hypothetical protein CQS82_21965 [Salmonella enterica]|nr:hypothetical protein [Salmonella enterica]